MYTIKLEQFEGPLDLLLHLVDKNQMDITEVALAAIAGEYEAYIRRLRNLNLEVESSFLTVFAALLEIKSKLLLPVPPKITEEDAGAPEPEHELVIRLREYRSFKEAARILEDMQEAAESAFIRPADDCLTLDEPVLASQLTGEDLMDIYINVLRKLHERQVENTPMEVVRETVSISLILRMITRKIRRKATTEFHELFDTIPDRVQFIITFLALLEMARRRKISLVQQDGETRFVIINKSVKEEQETVEAPAFIEEIA